MITRAVIAFLLLTATTLAGAQERYQIELILFTQPPLPDVQGELPVKNPPPFPAEIAWPLRQPNTLGVGPEALPSDQHRLTGAANRLRNQPGYQVIWHEAWRQSLRGPASAPTVSLPLELRSLGIEGRIRAYQSRFLHLETDIRLTDPTVWRLHESRRIRPSEVHYLDHPLLGIIVRIDPAPALEEAAEQQSFQ